MKLGIIGPANRAVAWEEHLRPHRTVEEVVITPNVKDAGDVDACLIIEESKDDVTNLLKAVRAGYHSFLVSQLPTDLEQVEKIYHTAEEANVLLQFAHWPTFAPASQWMTKQIAKPTFLQITREISYTDFLESKRSLEYYWIDELAFCLKWIDGNAHHIDVKNVKLRADEEHAIHLFLRFDSGATANMFINACASDNKHQRFAANYAFSLNCDVLSQTVRVGQANENKHLFFKKHTFDASRSAEIAATQFLKAIQLKKPTPFNGYDLLKLASQIEKITSKVT